MTQQLVSFEEKPEGLVITLLGDEEYTELKEIVERDDWTWDAKFGNAIEYQLGNGWDFLNDFDHKAIGALTESPILSPDVERNDEGDLTELKTAYWYPNYMILDPLEKILEDWMEDWKGQQETPGKRKGIVFARGN